MGMLVGLGQQLPNPGLLMSPFLRREAVLSSRIEGTQASLSDLVRFEASGEAPPGSDVSEVANYVRALRCGLDRLRDLPLSNRLLREVHEKLMHGVRGGEATPGEFRTTQNWIGAPGCTLNEAAFVPPPVDEMHACLADLERFLNGPPSHPPLIDCAIVHYQFEAIHPFIDGNGRVGRLLIILLMCQRGLLPQPLLYLSAYFERNRQAYYDYLWRVSQAGEWEVWIEFFLRGVREQAKDAFARAKRLLSLGDELRLRLHEARASRTCLRLLDVLVESPIISVPAAAKSLGVTYPAAASALAKLRDLGIAREVTTARPRLYVVDALLKVVEEDAG